MNSIWHKIWRDLWCNKLRTSLVVLSTGVGVFALGLVLSLSSGMRARMTESHRASRYPHIIVYTDQFGQDVVDAVRRETGIASVEGEDLAVFRWKPVGEPHYRDGYLMARADYEAQQLGLIELLEGQWPGRAHVPHARALAVERLSSQYFGLPVGATVIVEFGRYERRLPVTGIARPAQMFPPQFGGNAVFFVTQETFAWLTGWDEGFNRLNVRLESFSREDAVEAGERIADQLARMGVYVGGYDVFDPDVHWMQEQIDAVFLILAVLGVLSLGLSGFLIVNTMGATITQQVWQVGVMKAVGATRGSVVRVYLAMATVYGLLSLLLAVPLGAAAAHLLAGELLDLLNIVAGPFRLLPLAVVVQTGAGLIAPLLAALVPVLGGARVTVRQALSSHGIGSTYGRNWIDRVFERVRGLPRPLALSLRNTFRRKARVVLTLITLSIGGVMFIMVMSLGSSVDHTLDLLLDDLGYDVMVGFEGPYHVTRLTEVAERVPGVARAEVWGREYGVRLSLNPTTGEERELHLWGVPTESGMFRPRIISGRALMPGDTHAILLNAKIAADEGIQVGDEIELTISERASTWTVVGLVLNIRNQHRDSFVPFGALARATGDANRGWLMMVTSQAHDPATQQQVMRDLREAYSACHLEPAWLQSAADARYEEQSQFNLVTYLMLVMAALAALVGSVGLMSTMSINVVERVREIGVLRAIGATSAAIVGLFVGEGVLVGVLSWLIATPLSYPGARLFSRAVGVAWMNVPLDFCYSVGGVALWLAAVTMLSALASLWPALRATKISVHQVLAYE